MRNDAPTHDAPRSSLLTTSHRNVRTTRAAGARIGRWVGAQVALLLLTFCSVAVADPTATAGATPNPVAVGQTVSFSAAAATDPDASIVEYDWDFGDGDTCFDCGPSTSYTYQQSGNYTVTVTVTDSNFATTSSTIAIDVVPGPPLPTSFGPPSSGAHGGTGSITLGGRVGSLQLDSSTDADVFAFAGLPDATGVGNFDAIPHGPNYFALGYSCSANAGRGLGLIDGSAFCKTVFYINAKTQRLVAFHSSSPLYSFRTASPGMATSRAQRRMHRLAQGGCLTGFFFFSRRNHASLFAEVDGGRATLHGRGPNTVERVSGGHLEALELETNRHPVGLLFC
jgi:PKD domain